MRDDGNLRYDGVVILGICILLGWINVNLIRMNNRLFMNNEEGIKVDFYIFGLRFLVNDGIIY